LMRFLLIIWICVFCWCRILASLYSGSVCIWDYQSQARAQAFSVVH
jgi:hypothetical protein